eukprot:1611230-Rhodomonas_salina.2
MRVAPRPRSVPDMARQRRPRSVGARSVPDMTKQLLAGGGATRPCVFSWPLGSVSRARGGCPRGSTRSTAGTTPCAPSVPLLPPLLPHRVHRQYHPFSRWYHTVCTVSTTPSPAGTTPCAPMSEAGPGHLVAGG